MRALDVPLGAARVIDFKVGKLTLLLLVVA
jgi:hypothetical protein